MPSDERNARQPDDQNSQASGDPSAPQPQGEAAEGDLAGHRVDTQIAELQAAVNDAEKRFLRSQAELENYRKRARRDLDEQLRYAALPLVTDILPVLDNLSRALEAAQKSAADTQALVDGVQMVADQLRSVLEKHHCRRIPAAGELFDPNFHSAIGQVPTRDVPPGHVVHVAQEGYQLHDRVVRPAQVLVASEPADDAGAGK
jgi:molecular chaperone GrpE